MIRIIPIQTGSAQLKEAQRCGLAGRSAFQRKIDIFRDNRWVGPVPIFCFLIEHSEGRFLVDTGDTARNSVPGYLPTWNPFFMKEVIIKVAPLEEIGPRLQAMNLDPPGISRRSYLLISTTITRAASITSRTPASSAGARLTRPPKA